MRIYCHRSYSKYPHVIISTSTQGIWYISISSNKCLVSQMLAMETFIKILLSAIIFIKVKGEKNTMSKHVIEKLSPVDKQVGHYAMGQ